jgi:hypothetical protein
MKLHVESEKAKKAAKEAKENKMLNWHPFFTLIPRKVTTADPLKDVWVWLETIERKKYPLCYIGPWVLSYYYNYRLIENKTLT